MVLLALILVPSLSHAKDSSSGCGLGWEVAKENSLLSSFARALTNATFLNTVAMTFGTSGCTKHTIVQKEKEAQYFAEANYHNLLLEMAMGNGQNLENFAAVLGCNADHFAERMQSHFAEIFPSRHASPDGMLENVRAAITFDPELRAACAPRG
jgi:hypothetical protein